MNPLPNLSYNAMVFDSQAFKYFYQYTDNFVVVNNNTNININNNININRPVKSLAGTKRKRDE